MRQIVLLVVLGSIFVVVATAIGTATPREDALASSITRLVQDAR